MVIFVFAYNFFCKMNVGLTVVNLRQHLLYSVTVLFLLLYCCSVMCSFSYSLINTLLILGVTRLLKHLQCILCFLAVCRIMFCIIFMLRCADLS